MVKIIQGDLIRLALDGHFDLIAHGCNCFVNMGAGIAVQIAGSFPSALIADSATKPADYNKMGNYTLGIHMFPKKILTVLNLYTQYFPGVPSPGCPIPFDYTAFEMCLKKINVGYKGCSIGLPWIGCGLAGANQQMVEEIIKVELHNLDVTIVNYKIQNHDRRSAANVAGGGLEQESPSGESLSSGRKGVKGTARMGRNLSRGGTGRIK